MMFFKKKKNKGHDGEEARRNPQHRVHLTVLCIFFCFYAFLIIFPYFYVLLNSFKGGQVEFLADPTGFPKVWHFKNYLKIFQLEEMSVLSMFTNTIILCLLTPTLTCLVTTFAAYPMAKYKFSGKKFVYALFMVPMLVPLCGSTMATYKLLDRMGLIGNINSLLLMACCGTGMNFLLVTALFENVSNTYMEAAEIDGANFFQVFFIVMLPHAKGLIGIIWLTSFISQWNDYSGVKIFMGAETDFPTIATGVQWIYRQVSGTANEEYIGNYPLYYATVIVTVIPVITLFLIFQKQIMKMSLGGGIKE